MQDTPLSILIYTVFPDMYTLTEGAHTNINIIPIQTIINADAGIMDLATWHKKSRQPAVTLLIQKRNYYAR